jgi:hypothetical protein
MDPLQEQDRIDSADADTAWLGWFHLSSVLLTSPLPFCIGRRLGEGEMSLASLKIRGSTAYLESCACGSCPFLRWATRGKRVHRSAPP